MNVTRETMLKLIEKMLADKAKLANDPRRAWRQHYSGYQMALRELRGKIT